MNKKFFTTAIITTIVNLLFHTMAYVFILRDFYKTHPAISIEFMRQLSRPAEQLIVWAMTVTSFSMGFLITLIIQWSGARTFYSGLKRGFVFSALFWGSVNFGLFASSNFFSTPSVFVDYTCSVTAMTLGCGISALILGNNGRIIAN